MVCMNSTHLCYEAFEAAEKPKSLALMCTHGFVAVRCSRLQILGIRLELSWKVVHSLDCMAVPDGPFHDFGRHVLSNAAPA